MTNRDRLLADLHNLQYDRLAIQILHDDLARISNDLKDDVLSPSELASLREEHKCLTESLKLTVNHVARLERLLGFLSPEEQLVLDRMLVHPYKKCTLDLMEELHCEMSSVYRLRTGAIKISCTLLRRRSCDQYMI